MWHGQKLNQHQAKLNIPARKSKPCKDKSRECAEKKRMGSVRIRSRSPQPGQTGTNTLLFILSHQVGPDINTHVLGMRCIWLNPMPYPGFINRRRGASGISSRLSASAAKIKWFCDLGAHAFSRLWDRLECRIAPSRVAPR